MDAAFAHDFASWGPRPPVASQVTAGRAVDEALLLMRREKLRKIVRGVVVASSVICLAALVRAAFGGASGEEAEAHATMRYVTRDVPAAIDTVHAELDSLTKRTMTALHADQRRASSHAYGSARTRFSW